MAQGIPLKFTAIGLLSAATCFWLWKVIWNIFFSPIRQIPGPFYAQFFGQWLSIAALSGRRTAEIHKLHQKYGPMVRIGPSEISFSGLEHVRDIYGQASVFMKAPIYETFGRKGIFAMRDKEEHRDRRRLLSYAFSQANIYSLEPVILSKYDIFEARIARSQGKPVDALHWVRMIALDVIGQLLLGNDFGALDQDEPPPYVHDLDNFFFVHALKGGFPTLFKTLRILGPSWLRHDLGGSDRIYEYGAVAYKKYRDRTSHMSGPTKDLIGKLIESAGKEGLLSDSQISDEISNLIFAGTDTTATTLTYLLWELAKDPLLQEQVYYEVETLSSAAGVASLKFVDLNNAKLVDAVVNETLRLHPAVPSSLARIAPRGGASIGNAFMPEGTIVSMQCYTTHRDPVTFPEPDKFDASRWLVNNGQLTPEMKELFMPFTKGTRTCIGKSLSLMEMKLITARLISRFRIKLAPEMKEIERHSVSGDGIMEMRDRFLLYPKGGRCVLTFHERKTRA